LLFSSWVAVTLDRLCPLTELFACFIESRTACAAAIRSAPVVTGSFGAAASAATSTCRCTSRPRAQALPRSTASAPVMSSTVEMVIAMKMATAPLSVRRDRLIFMSSSLVVRR
jgi:hypothetical protein